MSAEHYTYGRRWSHISKAWIFEDSWNAQEEAAHLEHENAQLKAELVKAVRERDELQRLYDAGKATWDPVYKIVLDERDRLKERLAYQDRWLSGGVYYTNDEATALYKKHNDEVEKLKTELAQCQADKDEMVRRNKLLRDRPDLPMERFAAYDEVMTKLAQTTQREARLREAIGKFLEMANTIPPWESAGELWAKAVKDLHAAWIAQES